MHKNHKCLFFIIKLGSQGDFFHDGSLVFIQMPGDHVVAGTLHHFIHQDGIPNWMTVPAALSRYRLVSPQRVFLIMPGYRHIYSKANLEGTLYNRNDSNFEAYNCFVKTENAVLKADLVPQPAPIRLPPTPHIYVRMPGSNIVYGGQILHLAHEDIPTWLQ